ncbi:hypothetical protein [Conexibacter woesei]|uniref:Uncharacterized protein n=1 Tax=Conexibacter woesei (strain DSM 14684 / CCUG 47730 / CIP 108061 / JCM 11494 / NBRC 100937 / ID131577) TaxID=469383 RepID=D3F8V6_CONWI|nr:hypothetical protein [Conexibacter woesei]ADB52951.1 hypothetical protein Cwoe_4538 [Conexibacter woesei DSM 14684]
MSGALAHARGLFVAAPARPAATTPLTGRPQVAVLCSPARAQAAAASVALALAAACSTPFSLACAVGTGAPAPASLAPGARRAVVRLRQRGEHATAVGRVVWLTAEPPAGAAGDVDAGRSAGGRSDAAGTLAGASRALGRAAGAVAAPAVLAVPFARTAAIDRVLGWCDAIVVVRDAETPTALAELVLGSIEELRRPVVAMDAPARIAARAATAGLRAPAVAVDAVARLYEAGSLR